MNIFEIRIQRQCDSGWLVVVTQTSTDNFLPIRNEGTLNLPSDYSIQLRRLQAQPKAYGTLLGEAVFKDLIRDAFVNAFSHSENGFRVLLYVEDPELESQIAWQRICAPIGGNWDFLALNQRVPFSLYLPSNTNRHFPPIGKRDLNALILVASPEDLGEYRLHPFDVEETVSSLKKALGKIPTDVLANITNSVGKPTPNTFYRQLTSKRYTLLHIVCHGQFSHSGETILYWADQNHQAEPISATSLLEQLQRQHKGLPYFTFLSTCESAVPAAEMALGGLAQRMVKELGMPAVIAMTQKISIKTAAFLSTEFYQRLRDRGEVDVALVEATAACAERFDILVPALFSRLRGQRLFCEVLDRNLSNTEIENGLSRLPELLEVRSPISMKRLFPPLNSILQKTLKTDPKALSPILKSGRQSALTELNSLCDRVLEISFNALALDHTPPVYDPRCPFQGLYSFRYENREFFFGRERLIEELKQKLAHEHFLAIVGRSGCGKSSLVLAGLVPALQEEQPELQLVDITPGQNPLEQLLAGLSSLPNQPSIIVVDQFEELFTLSQQRLLSPDVHNHSLQQKALDYLENRGITPEMAQRYNIGLSFGFRTPDGRPLPASITFHHQDAVEPEKLYLRRRYAPWRSEDELEPGTPKWGQSGVPPSVWILQQPEQQEAKKTYLTEGPWDAVRLAEAVRQSGEAAAVACTSTGARGVPPPEQLKAIPGDEVVIFYDRFDEHNEGQIGASQMAQALRDVGKKASVALVPHRGEVKKGWDISDAFDSGFTLKDLQTAETEAIATATLG